MIDWEKLKAEYRSPSKRMGTARARHDLATREARRDRPRHIERARRRLAKRQASVRRTEEK